MAYAKMDTIVADSFAQSRHPGLDEATVERYVAVLEESGGVWPFPPLDLFLEGGTIEGDLPVGGVLRIGAGFHRYEAGRRYNERHPEKPLPDMIPATIHVGGQREAFLFNAHSNRAHGLQLSEGDKRFIVVRLLTDQEWSGWSDNMLADRAGVSQPLVSKIRTVLVAIADCPPDMPLEEVKKEAALKASVATGYVESILSLLPEDEQAPGEPAAAGDPEPANAPAEGKGKKGGKAPAKTSLKKASVARRADTSGTRRVKRGDKEYDMKTADIGKKGKGKASAAAEQATLPTAPEPAAEPAKPAAPAKLPKKKKGNEAEYVAALLAAETPRIDGLRQRVEAATAEAQALSAEYAGRGEMAVAAGGAEKVARLLAEAAEAIRDFMIPSGVCGCQGTPGKGCVECIGSGWLTAQQPEDEPAKK